MIDVTLWYLFPLSILISSIAMMSGIGGSVMFSPVFMLILGLDAISAFATGLIIELFGFSSGMIAYWRKKLVDFSLVRKIGFVAFPSVVVGIVLARFLPPVFLKIILAALLLYLAISFLIQKKKCDPKLLSCDHETITLPKSQGKTVSSNILASSALGGLLLGSISSGFGEINEYTFLKKLQLSVPIASGTSVFLVAIGAFVGVLIHAGLFFFEGAYFPFSEIISILLFVLPGVVLGAQIGAFTSQKINLDHMGLFIGGLFLVLSAMVLISIL